MTGWTTYKGLELPDSSASASGDTLTENLRLLADGVGSGLPAAADSYVIVQRGVDDVESAANLRSAYAAAKLLTPGGNALSAGNRAVCFVPPGRYDFGTGDASNHGLVLDEEFVDLIGLGSNRDDTVLTSQIATASRGTVEQTASNVKTANLTLAIVSGSAVGSGSTTPAAYFPSTNLPGANCANVAFTSGNSNAYSMRYGVEYSGSYTNCTAGNSAFGGGGGGTASGVFASCIGGNSSFGFSTASGTFNNCTSGDNSFGGDFGAVASGTFVNCVGGSACFGGYINGIASGTFVNCSGSISNFGGNINGTASGTFTNCLSSDLSFGRIASGTFIECIGGSASFGGGASGVAAGNFINCKLGTKSGGTTSLGVQSWAGVFTGLMEGCHWQVTGTNQTALKVSTGARIYNSTLIGSGTGKSIDSSSAVNVEISNCQTPQGIGSNVTNTLPAPINQGGTGAVTASAARTNLGLAIGTDVQSYNAQLGAIAGLSSNGLIARTASGTAASRTLTGTANRISVTNGDGVSGNPTLTVPDGAQLNIDDITGTTEVTINEAGANLDFRIEGDTDANLLFVDASTDRVGIGIATPSYKLDVIGSIRATGTIVITNNSGLDSAFITTSGVWGSVINEGGFATDFRVESDTQTHMLYVDGTNNRVSIGGSTNIGLPLQINGETNITGNIRYAGLSIISGTTPSVTIGATAANSWSSMVFNTSTGSAVVEFGRATVSSWVGNENGIDFDHRWEGDTDANLLTLDASTDSLGVGVALGSHSASAKCQIDSSTKGFLPPRQTTAQRNAISSPAQGLQVHDSDLDRLMEYDGSVWRGLLHTVESSGLSAAASFSGSGSGGVLQVSETTGVAVNVSTNGTGCLGLNVLADDQGGVGTAAQFANAAGQNIYFCDGTYAIWAETGSVYFGEEAFVQNHLNLEETTANIYMGNANTNGSWRFSRSGNDLLIQRRESGIWVTKSTIAA